MIDFLRKIYTTNCNDGDYVFLSTKKVGTSSKKGWRDHPIQFKRKTIKRELTKFFESYPKKQYDLYFSPVPFSKPHRLKDYAKDTKYLTHDIDEIPLSEVDPQPTYLWKTSPDKHQGMWELDKYIPETLYTSLNPYMARNFGFDSACDIAHVYRVPETINHKYKNDPKISKVKKKDGQTIYRLTRFKKDIKYNDKKQTAKVPKKRKGSKGGSDKTERQIYADYDIPHSIRDLLAFDSLDDIDDRSGTIWFIENTLINDVGMPPNEVIYLIKNSVFNKYKGRRDEDKQLMRELRKIMEGKVEKKTKAKKRRNRLLTVPYNVLRGRANMYPEWLVRGFWGKESNGIVAGMPKSYKSTVTMDFAISVASGRPFLGIYPVENTGGVLIIQNENAENILNDRMNKIATSKGLGGKVKFKGNTLTGEFPPDLPITFVNNMGFNLSSEEDCQDFEELLSIHKPVLVILDPLYLMFTGDMNSAQDLTPILNYLHHLRDKYHTSIMLIHHYNKGSAVQGSAGKGGHRMAGSVFLYGWIENAWYFEKMRDEETGLIDLNFMREFRGAGGFADLDLQLTMGGSEEDSTYRVEVFEDGNRINFDVLVDTTVSLLKRHEGKVLSKRFIKQELALEKPTFDKIIKKLIKRHKIKKVKGGYTLDENSNR